MFSFPTFPTAFVLATCLGVASLPGVAAEADPASDTTPDNISTGLPADGSQQTEDPIGSVEIPSVTPEPTGKPEPISPDAATGEPSLATPEPGSTGKVRQPAPAQKAPISTNETADLSQASFNIAPGVSMVRDRAPLGPVSTATILTRVAPGASVTIEPITAGGSTVRGLRTVPDMAKRSGALMMINGGFWRSGPGGNPNGTWIVHGEMLSEPESQGVGPRGTIGWLHDGRVVVDRITANLSLTGPNNLSIPVKGINRDWRRTPDATTDTGDAVLVYNAAYGGPVKVTPPPGGSGNLTTIRVKANAWPGTGTVTAEVLGVSTGPATLTPRQGEVLVTARGKHAAALASVKIGQQVNLNSQLVPMDPAHAADWAHVHTAVAGGPQVLRNGQVTPAADWVSEGFEPHIHSNVRHPRTAIGRTANNETVMVTADGRQKGYSAGLTIRELGQYMASKGVVDAVSLDGGGSTQATVGSQIVNRPCCDSSLRRVANGIALKARQSRVRRLSGPERISTAARAATSAFSEGKTPTVVLARADVYPDALSGAALAGAVGGPVLLSNHDQVPKVTMDAIRHLGATHVAILGGRAAIGNTVEDQLRAAGLTVVRMSGPGRSDTAAEAARAIALQVRQGGGTVDHAFIVAGDQWADALVAGGPAGLMKSPILLTNPSTIDAPTAQVLHDLGIKKVTLVGDTNRLSPQLETDMKVRGITAERIGQPNPYATSVQMNDWMRDKVTNLNNGLVVATGENFPDGLAAGPTAARKRLPLVLVPGTNLGADPLMMEWIARHTDAQSRLYVLGGLKVIPDTQLLILDRLGTTNPAAKDGGAYEVAESEGIPLAIAQIAQDQTKRLGAPLATPTTAKATRRDTSSSKPAASSEETAKTSESASKPTTKASATAAPVPSEEPIDVAKPGTSSQREGN
ncbi:cell wall-binding repeat-containing protein [Stomatohabitans albus]|uniref:cell wall-binding repeat-containing protein n=1 Tax=Stomatohabitans albus TaxID=3110766 RepID=UPI00300CB751